MRDRAIAFFALILFSACGGNGIGSGVCNPECAAGFHCDNSSNCVADGNSDDASVPRDMSATCSPACIGLTPHCNDSNHCVGCVSDDQCSFGQFCKTLSPTVANCTPGCMNDDRCAPDGGVSSMSCCSMQCVDTATDPRNCGTCGKSCTANHSQGVCKGSACATGNCDIGWGDCDGNAQNGCEANLHVDPTNCGGCGNACSLANAISGCSDACYIEACNFGFDDCNQSMDDGCETSVSSDTSNCGGCGIPCNGLPNAAATCTSGNCVLGACNVGFFNCDNNPQNGCEVAIGTDVNNCGKCGNVCGNGLVCVNGGCTCPKCNFPNAASSCVNNVCVMGACVQGWGDCNGQSNDGCEVDVTSSPNNCNQCGNVCPNNNPFCNKGVCGQVPPAVVYTDAFVQNQTPAQQCTDWRTFQGALTNGPYTTVTIKGSNDMVGVSCTGAMANQLCQALRNNQAASVVCNGVQWSTGPCGGNSTEISQSPGTCQCNTGYTSRPCIGNLNWGGINGTTCTAPSQTITVLCQE